ncbi:class I SAM-dependent methyltransferase [Amycolatopsis eburnea]|uniref:class I SAM-dependent methyltransferase n=1 Tax=Amycolatopsis eburnea TaxID=2267691 RepID=UPI00384B6A94
MTGSYRRHLRGLAADLATAYPSASVVEIGSNHGVLLAELAARGLDVLGVDPNGFGPAPVVREFFGAESARRLSPVDIVAAVNTLAYVEDPADFLTGVRAILRPGGVFVSESHYLPDLLETLQYDFFYHEHPRYYSLTALEAAFAPHGLEVFRVERIPTRGGSLRVYAGSPGESEVDESVAALREFEKTLRLNEEGTYRKFAARVAEHRERLRGLLAAVKRDGSRVAAATSPARATTLLTYCGLGPADLGFVSEVNPRKIGRLSPGAHLPVVAQERLCGPDQPEYALLLSWHIADELMSLLRADGFRGRFIVPLPEPVVV